VRALACDRYGTPDVVELRDVPRPGPRPGGVPVRVRAAGVSAGDGSFALERGAGALRAFARREARGTFAIVVAD